MQVWIFSWDGDGGGVSGDLGWCGGGDGGCMGVLSMTFALDNINNVFKTNQMLAINTKMKLIKAVGN